MRTTKTILKKVRKYSEVLKKNNFKFEAIYLFGSYAKGTQNKYSDIDVCVVSKAFNKKDLDKYEQNTVVLWDLRHLADDKIEPIGLSPSELNSWYPLSNEIKTTGILVE